MRDAQAVDGRMFCPLLRCGDSARLWRARPYFSSSPFRFEPLRRLFATREIVAACSSAYVGVPLCIASLWLFNFNRLFAAGSKKASLQRQDSGSSTRKVVAPISGSCDLPCSGKACNLRSGLQ